MMNDIEQKTLIDDHENRIKRLENDENVNNILHIVQKIEARLLGGLDSETPGLIPDFKQTKKDVDDIKARFGQIETCMKEIKDNLTPIKTVVEDYKEIRKEVKSLTMHKYILYGGMIVIGYLLTHPEIIRSIIGIK